MVELSKARCVGRIGCAETFSPKMSAAKTQAIEALSKLAAAAQRLPAGTIPEWISRVESVVRADDPDPKKVSSEVQSVRTFLCRGEWDQLLVEKGRLPYLDIFLIPIALLEYCETLNLDAETRMGVEIQLGRDRHALRSNKMREQDVDLNT